MSEKTIRKLSLGFTIALAILAIACFLAQHLCSSAIHLGSLFAFLSVIAFFLGLAYPAYEESLKPGSGANPVDGAKLLFTGLATIVAASFAYFKFVTVETRGAVVAEISSVVQCLDLNGGSGEPSVSTVRLSADIESTNSGAFATERCLRVALTAVRDDGAHEVLHEYARPIRIGGNGQTVEHFVFQLNTEEGSVRPSLQTPLAYSLHPSMQLTEADALVALAASLQPVDSCSNLDGSGSGNPEESPPLFESLSIDDRYTFAPMRPDDMFVCGGARRGTCVLDFATVQAGACNGTQCVDFQGCIDRARMRRMSQEGSGDEPFGFIPSVAGVQSHGHTCRFELEGSGSEIPHDATVTCERHGFTVHKD